MRIAVIGSPGQLGTDLVAVFEDHGHEVIGLGHGDIEVENIESVHSALSTARPEVIVNTAAAHHLPTCEEEPGRAFSVNAIGSLNVARVASSLEALNVYFSTDYVFDGQKNAPYREDDLPRPLNVYAASKLAGEHMTLAGCGRACVIRISGIYGKVPCRAKGENFVTKMIQLAAERPEVKVVTDEILTPTPTRAIAQALPQILQSNPNGTFHLTCEGQCSWFDFARQIFSRLAIDTPLLPATSADFPTPFRRPTYSVLDNHRFNQLAGPKMPHWQDGLDDYLSEVGLR